MNGTPTESLLRHDKHVQNQQNGDCSGIYEIGEKRWETIIVLHISRRQRQITLTFSCDGSLQRRDIQACGAWCPTAVYSS